MANWLVFLLKNFSRQQDWKFGPMKVLRHLFIGIDNNSYMKTSHQFLRYCIEVYSSIHIQQIVPKVKGLLIQAGFLPKFCHFQNSWSAIFKIPDLAQSSGSSRLKDSQEKWLGILVARALYLGLYTETFKVKEKFCCMVLKGACRLQLKTGFE